MNDIIREVSENKPFLTRTDDLSDPAKVASQLNYTLGSLPLVGGNQFTLHTDNHDAMVAMAEEVDRATKYVHFEFYITAYDRGERSPLGRPLRSPRTRCTGARTPRPHRLPQIPVL